MSPQIVHDHHWHISRFVCKRDIQRSARKRKVQILYYTTSMFESTQPSSSIPARRALGPRCLFFYHCAVLVSDELLVLPLSRKLLVRSIGFQRKKGRLQGQGKGRTIPDWHQQVSFLSSSSSRFETWAQNHHRGHPHPHFRHRSCHPCQKQLFMVF